MIQREDFYTPLAYLANDLGYAWVSGKGSNYVGRDLLPTYAGNGTYTLNGNTAGSCTGYRCDERIKMKISDIRFELDPDTLKTGEITITNDDSRTGTLSRTLTNYSNIEQQLRFEFSYTRTNEWSKTNNFSFSESLGVKHSFKWGVDGAGGETELSLGFSAEQGWSNTNGGSTTETVRDTVVMNVPAHTRQTMIVDLMKTDVSYPYEFDADVSYDVTFENFLKYSGNAQIGHPTNRPNDKYTFTVGRYAAPEKNLEYQYDHRNIPGLNKKWDWNWYVNEHSLGGTQQTLGKVLRPKLAGITGMFYASGVSSGDITIGETTDVQLRSNGAMVVQDIDQETLARLEKLGFKDFKMTHVVENAP
jgi:hypothetical protein